MKKARLKCLVKRIPSNVFLHETWKLTTANNGISMLPKLIRYMEERKVYRECWVMPLLEFIVPIRLINGIDDPISGKHLTDRFAEFVPNADIVLLENCGHYPHVKTPIPVTGISPATTPRRVVIKW